MNNTKFPAIFRLQFVMIYMVLFTSSVKAAVIEVTVHAPSLFSREATLVVKNNSVVPRIVRVVISNNDDRSADIGTAVITVPEMKTIEIKVSPKEGKRYSAPLYWEWAEAIGDLNKMAKQKGYWIPFEGGVKTAICQYPHGKDLAIDFCVPIGTKIVAARSGVVYRVVDTFTEGGNDPKYSNMANSIEVYHDDGTRAMYIHLEPKSAHVQEGDRVERGQLLATVGLTGQTSGPHLHLHVTKYGADLKDSFIDPMFENESGDEFKIIEGEVVERTTGVQSKRNIEKLQTYDTKNEKSIKENKNLDDCGSKQVDVGKKAIDCIGKNDDKAIEYFNQYIKTHPSDRLALARLATSYTRANRHQEAIAAYKKAIAANWISYDFAYHYSTSLYEMGNNEEGLKWLKRSVDLQPECGSCVGTLARRFSDLKKYKDALRLLETFDERQVAKGRARIFSGQILLVKDLIEKSARP